MHSQKPSSLIPISASGFCRSCNHRHSLPTGTSKESGLALIQQLTQRGSVSFSKTKKKDGNDPLSTLPLWGEARGKMFGILDCLTEDNTPRQLYAFSGQFNGQWLVDGWVPPLFDVHAFHNLNAPREKEIKAITREIAATQAQTPRWLELRKTRRVLSQNLMKDIHSLYKLTNFMGETKTLEEVFTPKNSIPTGTGDCCAPKLLNYAATNDLTPIGLVEFFYGKETKSGSHIHGEFSSPCKEKCAPILGFMLCGVKE